VRAFLAFQRLIHSLRRVTMSTPLNDAFVPSQATRSSDRSGAPGTRLHGRRLILARVAWVAAVSLLVVSFLAMLPANYTGLQTVCTGATCGLGQPSPDSAQALQKLGLSVSTYAAFTLALTLASAFLCFTLGAVIFWRKSDDWMALLVALMVVATVTLNGGAALVLLMIAQVYRHRTAPDPLQRQQGKWLLFSGCVAVLIIVGIPVPPFLFPSLGQAGSFYLLIIAPAYLVLSLIFPIGIGLAILRYRLYDIDLIIHRTLLYSTLTFLLAAIYEVSVFTLQSLLGGLTLIRGNQLALVASTLLIGVLFKPLHDRTRALIDRRFYRRKYDAARTLAAFNTTIRDEVDLNQLCAQLMAVVQETMQPAHVSLWLGPPKRYSEQTTRALPIIDPVGNP
jgi:hypothetical protein